MTACRRPIAQSASVAARSATSSLRSSPGGPAPFIATALFATYHSSLPIALYILGCAVVGIVATALLTDHTNKDISAEYEAV
jgi:hypothetical protein